MDYQALLNTQVQQQKMEGLLVFMTTALLLGLIMAIALPNYEKAVKRAFLAETLGFFHDKRNLVAEHIALTGIFPNSLINQVQTGSNENEILSSYLDTEFVNDQDQYKLQLSKLRGYSPPIIKASEPLPAIEQEEKGQGKIFETLQKYKLKNERDIVSNLENLTNASSEILLIEGQDYYISSGSFIIFPPKIQKKTFLAFDTRTYHTTR